MDDTELLSSSDQKMDDALTGNPDAALAVPISSDDSGESDSDSEDEAESNHQIETLESELSANPYNYDAYVQYIKLLRKTANLEKLRQAREAMSAIFPLSPSLWLEWARDEASLASSDNVPEIVKLYERGLSDYQSVSLWCDYLNFLLEYDPSVLGYTSDGISRMRSLFERAIPAAGFHVTEGNRIWEGYREFEQGILATIDKADVEERNKQIQRIRSIFHRHLSVPLENLSSTLIAYKTWELEQGIDLDIGSDDLSKVSPQVAVANKKAQQMYSERAHLEENISKKDLSDVEKFQQFMNYIKFEQTSGDPTRVQAIYERAVAEYPVSSDLWIDYTCYLDKTLKVGKAITHAYSRATRSCPGPGDIWAGYLVALLRGSASLSYYKTRRITFGGRSVDIILQNGTCPLVAIANTVLLKGSLIEHDITWLSQAKLVLVLVKAMIEFNKDKNINVDENNLKNVLSFLAANKFRECEYFVSPIRQIVDLLGIALTEDPKADIHRKKEVDVGVFYRNTNFYTMVKYRAELYVLVNDQPAKQDLVWKKYTETERDVESDYLFTDSFKAFQDLTTESNEVIDVHIDAENVPVPEWISPEDLVNNLKRALAVLGINNPIKVHVVTGTKERFGTANKVSEFQRSNLEEINFEILENDIDQGVDLWIKAKLMALATERLEAFGTHKIPSPGKTVVLAVGDGGYCGSIHLLRLLGFRVLVLAPSATSTNDNITKTGEWCRFLRAMEEEAVWFTGTTSTVDPSAYEHMLFSKSFTG